MNKVMLVGRITKDPELKTTSSNNTAVVNFTLAVNRPFSDQQGDRSADFINCVVWRKQAENLAKYVKKGALLGVEGRIQTRSYEINGETRYATDIICDNIQFLESNRGESNFVKEEKVVDEEDPFAGKIKNVDNDDLPF